MKSNYFLQISNFREIIIYCGLVCKKYGDFSIARCKFVRTRISNLYLTIILVAFDFMTLASDDLKDHLCQIITDITFYGKKQLATC